MSTEREPKEQEAQQKIVESVGQAVSKVQSPAQADRVIAEVTDAASNVTTGAVATQTNTPTSVSQAADAIVQAADAPPAQQPQAALIEAAKQIAASDDPQTHAAITEALQRVTAANDDNCDTVTATERERRLLQDALLRHLGPLKAMDTAFFLWVNRVPHPPGMNTFMQGLSRAMNRGDAVTLGLLAAAIFDAKRGQRALREVLPTLLITTATVEYPVKYIFRRRRPFIAIVRSIVVGKKPGGYSFPSGHSAASFASAWLVSKHYPGLRGLLYILAGLVGFSRIYLGVHYPGDVLTGALSGVALAALYRRLIAWVMGR